MENEKPDGTGTKFNFILNNGLKTNMIYSKKYKFMMPEGMEKRITRVDVYSTYGGSSENYVDGFKFYDNK